MKFITTLILLFTLVCFAVAQEGPKALAPKAVAPVPLKLSIEDQKQLDLISERLTQMRPQLEAAQKQQVDAQARLNEANSFIAQYNQVDALKMAFFFRVAADVCGCKSSELEFTADGRNVVRKDKVAEKAAK